MNQVETYDTKILRIRRVIGEEISPLRLDQNRRDLEVEFQPYFWSADLTNS
jgi:hypothetical protein